MQIFIEIGWILGSRQWFTLKKTLLLKHTQGRMIFPSTRPDTDPVSLWAWQNKLLVLAQQLLGPRDVSKEICRPVFDENGPFIWHTPSLDGAFAALSNNAAGYWPTAVFELAHETAHLLNPIEGVANYLEEGIAVAFSLHVLKHYGLDPVPVSHVAYAEALELVQELPGEPFAVARAVRLAAGSPKLAQIEHLVEAAPDHPHDKLQRLLRKFPPR